LPANRAERGGELFRGAEYLLGIIQRDPPCLGQHQIAPTPFEQVVAKIGLQRLDLGRDRALRDIERACRRGQRAFARGRSEQSQVVQVEGRHGASSA
jgi:hypothetical protein